MSIRKKILVVEDNEAMNKALSGQLAADGYNVMSETSGKKALDKALAEHPDIIVLDILLPDMDGLTILEHLRGDAWGKDALVIMLTNLDTNDEMLKKVMKLEPRFYLVKQNMKLSEIVTKISECL